MSDSPKAESHRDLVDTQSKTSTSTDAAVTFAVNLGRALHLFGMPAHHLEDTMALVSRKLGLEGHFFSTPTGIFASFGAPEEQRTSLVRTDPGVIDLEKMHLLDELTKEVVRGTVEPDQGHRRVLEILAAPARYGAWITALCFGLSSGAAARLLGGGWREMAAAICIATVIGGLATVAGKVRAVARIYEPTAAVVASSLAVMASHVVWPLSVYSTTLASLIVLLPGLTLTVAMTELATQNLVSGTARLTGAGLLFLEIGFGVALGSQISRFLPAAPFHTESLPLPEWTAWAAVVVAAISLTVLFRARLRDIGWVLFAAVLSYTSARAGAHMLGPEFGVSFGALMLGIGGNLVARLQDRSSAIVIIPGLMLLVPGSIGYGSISSFLDRHVVTGVETAFRMTLIAVLLATGLLLANAAIPPRRPL